MVSIPTLRDPPPDDGPAPAPLDINTAFRHRNETTVVVNADTGTVLSENDDGSISAAPAGGEEKPSMSREDFNANLAETLDDFDSSALCSKLMEGIEADIRARTDWVETGNKGADYLGLKLEDASAEISPQGSISKVHNSLLLESVMRSWANSRAELLPVSGPVKVRDDSPSLPQQMGHNGGPPMDDMVANADDLPAALGGTQRDPALARNTLADAFEKDFNHYLTVVDREYYPDTSRMLFSRALLGCQFKKIYRDPILRRPVSRWVRGDKLIVSNNASHLLNASRVTEEINMSHGLVLRMQAIGHWRKVPLTTPVAAPSSRDQKIAETEGIKATPDMPEDWPHTIYECYCDLMRYGLGKDETGHEPGYPLPYRVTIDKDSRKVVEIRRNWKQGDPDYKRRLRYVKFGFVPGLGFYDNGFIHLIGNPQRACTAIERMLIDAGMFASFPGGVIARGAGSRQTNTQIRVGPSQFQTIDTGGLPIQQVIMPLPYKEPSQTLFALGQDIAAQGRRIASVLELPLGEGRVGDVPVGTIMSYIDSISKVPSAIHKDDHMAQQDEFEKLRELFEEEPEALHKFARSPAHKWAQAKELADHELVPAADPNVPSHMHRIIQAQALAQAAGLPQFMQANIPNQRGIWEWVCRTLAVDPQSVTNPEQPQQQAPPDPKAIQAMAKAQTDQQRNQLETQKLQVESADRAADRASRERVAAMHIDDSRIKTQGELAKAAANQSHEATQGAIDRQHEAAQNDMDRQHEARGGVVELLHKSHEAAQDRAHERATAAFGRATI